MAHQRRDRESEPFAMFKCCSVAGERRMQRTDLPGQVGCVDNGPRQVNVYAWPGSPCTGRVTPWTRLFKGLALHP
jgi:hypothetical protein